MSIPAATTRACSLCASRWRHSVRSGISEAAARWLVDARDISAVGIDTPSIDRGQSSDFRAHVIFYGENIVGFENVATRSSTEQEGLRVDALVRVQLEVSVLASASLLDDLRHGLRQGTRRAEDRDQFVECEITQASGGGSWTDPRR